MKKVFILFLTVFCTVTAFAQLNSSEKALQNQLKSFLSKEGYRPEIDQDEDLSFKKEGTLYWIHIEQEDQGYFFVTLNHNAIDCEDADLHAVRKAINEINLLYKCGKCYYSEKNKDIQLKIEGFYKLADDFSRFFDRHMQILSQMDDEVKELYSKYSE